MGKPTGFLEFARKGDPAEAPLERICHYREFHPHLPKEERQKQGARCMECGIPFCQSGAVLNGMVSGCPLHNLIPEWNDLTYTGSFHQAAQRLLKTNNFPEFTGRVCPALCEAACTCGLNGDPVTIKENELGIIEEAWAGGWMEPHPPAIRTGKAVAVVGSGPSGLAAAAQLNSRGHTVTVFEKADRAGGLLMYGIPNMKLQKEIVLRRTQLMEAEGIHFQTGVDVGRDLSPKELLDQFDAVVLCCGAGQPRDLKVENRDVKGVHFAVDFLTATTKSLLDSGLKDGKYVSARGKDVVIVGGGDTGNDCVGTSIRHGCRSVVQLEMMPKAPDARGENNPWPEWPRVCKTDYGQEEASAKFGSDPRIYQTTVTKLISDKDKNLTAIETVKLGMDLKPIPGTEETMACQLLLIAAGFLGPRKELPEAFALELTERSNVKTPAGSCATNVPKVFSAGDMRRGQSLVVWAIQEGRAAAREVDQFLMGYTGLS